MHCDAIVISDAVLRRVNLEMALFASKHDLNGSAGRAWAEIPLRSKFSDFGHLLEIHSD